VDALQGAARCSAVEPAKTFIRALVVHGGLQETESAPAALTQDCLMKSKPSRSTQRRLARDNRANQLNRNNDAFWKSRGHPERPTDWRTATPTLRPRPPSRKPR
jgi:hypothetical protein